MNRIRNHGSDFNLPSKSNKNGWLKTDKTSENIERYKDEIKKLLLTGERIVGIYRKGESNQFSVIYFYDHLSGCNAIFNQNQETREFISAWKLNQRQISDLLINKNIEDYWRLLMDYNTKRYFDLLEEEEIFKKQKVSFYKVNREDYIKLLNYKVRVENQKYWENRQKYVSVMSKFVNSLITVEDFIDEFFDLWIKDRYQNENKINLKPDTIS